MSIEHRAEQQQGIGARAVSALKRERIAAREGSLHRVEGARKRQWRCRIGTAERVTFDVGLDLGVDRFDRIAESEQIAETFALLQTKLRAALFRIGERTLECSASLHKGGDEGEWQGFRGGSRGPQFGSPAQAIAHQRLGARTVTRTYCGKDRVGQACDGDRGIGEAPVAAGVVGRETLEQWEQRYDRADSEQGLDQRRPLGGRRGGPVNANAVGGGYSHTRPFVPAAEALHLLQRAEPSCRCTGRAPGKAKTRVAQQPCSALLLHSVTNQTQRRFALLQPFENLAIADCIVKPTSLEVEKM